jgi:RNA polymerase sigma factor (sigma-70 family)
MESKMDLWQRFKSGDDQALSLLYNSYVHQLFSYGLKISGDESLVKDCIQEVFMQLIDKRAKMHVAEHTAVYLFKSLRNKILEELRTKNRRSDIARSIVDETDGFEWSPEQNTVRNEEENSRLLTMQNALNSLSEYQKEAIFLKYSQGMDYDTLAETLEIDISSARTLIYRSIKKVKELLKKH